MGSFIYLLKDGLFDLPEWRKMENESHMNWHQLRNCELHEHPPAFFLIHRKFHFWNICIIIIIINFNAVCNKKKIKKKLNSNWIFESIKPMSRGFLHHSTLVEKLRLKYNNGENSGSYFILLLFVIWCICVFHPNSLLKFEYLWIYWSKRIFCSIFIFFFLEWSQASSQLRMHNSVWVWEKLL